MAVVASKPGRRAWTIRRRWAPRAPRWRRFLRPRRSRRPRSRKDPSRASDVLYAIPRGDAADLGWGLLVIALAALIIWIGLPLILFALESLYFMLLVVAGILARVFLRRPWTIEARAGGLDPRTYAVVGWRRSARAIERLAEVIRAQGSPPAQLPETPTTPFGRH